MQQSYTIGMVAQRLSCPVHRIRYIVDTRHLEPSGHVGRVRLFSADDLVRISSELARIERAKGGDRE